MAASDYTFSVNHNYSSGVELLFGLKGFLGSLPGWSIPQSGSGNWTGSGNPANAPYTAAGDLFSMASNPAINTSGTGPGSLLNSGAWLVVQMPTWLGYARQFCFQRQSNVSSVLTRATYSASGAFAGGTGTTAPTAADSVPFVGSGTDGAPVFSSYVGTDGTYYSHFGARVVAPYGWYCVSHAKTTNLNSGSIFVDPLISGTFPAADIDPLVLNHFTGSFTMTTLASPTNPNTWFKRGLGGAGFVTAGMMLPNVAGNTIVPSALGVNGHDGRDDLLALPYLRRSASGAPAGYKGQGHLVVAQTAGRSTGHRFNLVDAEEYKLALQDVAIPWPEATTPLLPSTTASATIFDANLWGAGLTGPAPDITPPTVTLVSPANGSAITPTTTLVATYADDETAPRSAIVGVKFPSGEEETVCRVYDDAAPYFPRKYNRSTAVAVTNGYQLTITRRGGWPEHGLELIVDVVDRSGNRAE